MIQIFFLFDFIDRDPSLESFCAVFYCGAVCLFFQSYPVCNFGKFVNFGLGTVRSARVNSSRIDKSQMDTLGLVNSVISLFTFFYVL